MTYDFLGSAYLKTSLEELNYALTSIHNQTLKPNKVVLVLDGPVKNGLLEIEFISSYFLKRTCFSMNY